MRAIILITLAIMTGSVHGQNTTGTSKHVVKPKGTLTETRLIINNFGSDVIIEGTTKSEIEIVTDNLEEKPERADGLRSLSEIAMENTAIGLNVEFKGNEIYVTPASRRAESASYTFYVPKSIKVKVTGESFSSHDIVVKGMSNEIELSTQSGDILINEVTGPIVAKTISGDIEIGFNSLNQKLPSSLNTISGDIDITLSASDKGSFSISSISGEVFTDLDLKVKKSGKSLTDIDIDVDIDIDPDVKVETAREEQRMRREIQRAERETQRAMAEKERAMAELNETIREEVERELGNNRAPNVPTPPQVPFHFNWATPSGIGSKFQAELNGGGVSFAISSISGDVYLRKSEK